MIGFIDTLCTTLDYRQYSAIADLHISRIHGYRRTRVVSLH
jgi:hypothetical protein